MPKIDVDLSSDKQVPPIGPKDADIVLIGEAAGRVEEKQGKPFVGSSGRLLNQLLRSANIKRSDCYITNVIKKRPKNNNFGTFYQDSSKNHPKQYLHQARENLRKELKEVDPNVIIPLGNESLQALMGREDMKITNYRGSIIRHELGKIIPTFHPSYIMRMFKMNPVASFDLQRAKKESKKSELDLPKRNLQTSPSYAEAIRFLDKCLENDFISFDIEAFKIKNKPEEERWWYVDCVGFAYSDRNAMCIPLTYPSGSPYWSMNDEVGILRKMAEVLGSWDTKVIAQNMKYDSIFMERLGVPVNNMYLDTMVAANTMHAEFPRGLDFLTSIYTREPYYKDQMEDDRWVYNAKDAVVTYEIGKKFIEEELEDYNVKDFYFNKINPLIEIFKETEQKGVRVDDEEMEHLGDPLEEKIERLRDKLKELTGKEINVYSVTDMREYIYEDLGLDKKYNDNDNLDTSKEVLNNFYRNTGREEFQVMMDLRQARSRSSTYMNASRSPDGRIRTSYKLSTKSGRLSSTKDVFKRGMNLQNVEKEYRTIFIPDKGCKFLSADLGQAENRVVAYLSGDRNMIDVVESEGDIHRQNAAMIFDKPEDKITTEERQLGKRITHASNYCMGPRTFSKFAKVTTRRGKQLLRRYHNTYPKVEKWQKEVENEVRKTRELRNPFGRIRKFHGRLNSTLFREAVSFIPQSSVADCMHRATREIYSQLPEGARVSFQLHDEITVQAEEDLIKETAKIMRKALTRPFTIEGKEISIPTDVCIGSNWKQVSDEDYAERVL